MRRLLSFALIVLILFSVPTLSGCDIPLYDAASGNPTIPLFNHQKYQVTFVTNNGTPNEHVTVESGNTVATPTDPEKENYLFRGWYTDIDMTDRYDFSKPVTKPLTLYAKYELDAVTLTNKIYTGTIKGVVKIYNKSYNSFFGMETTSATSQGSGFCFHIQNGVYYILTNCHVAVKQDGYDNQKFTIEDYQGRTYEGYLLRNATKTMDAISAEYDLACLYFKASSTNVERLPIMMDNPATGADVISIGAPQGQANSITYGQIMGYGKVTLTDTSVNSSNVTFEVIGHDANVGSGSSGGPLLDADLNVIGVNYAGSNETGHGAAIPIEKVNEFLDIYVYN